MAVLQVLHHPMLSPVEGACIIVATVLVHGLLLSGPTLVLVEQSFVVFQASVIVSRMAAILHVTLWRLLLTGRVSV